MADIFCPAMRSPGRCPGIEIPVFFTHEPGAQNHRRPATSGPGARRSAIALLISSGRAARLACRVRPGTNFGPTLAALIFSVPVAVRRRWPLPGMLVIIGAVAIKTAVEHGSGALGGAAGVLPALLLMGYAVGRVPASPAVSVGVWFFPGSCCNQCAGDACHRRPDPPVRVVLSACCRTCSGA